ncbi:uncharacterized protein LOC129802795 isoform X2 [Phlebotomus papatasi]|uniref:uncharacterized protein LOC129802795 isoform X2 n=1 Tax=Phlebotomus papatasi TaxID=29031 RepID=UPI0024843F1F|nr:uncharacterized protein LOC129802795 isoform X2 [Phlebotomus papatasi]
MASDFVREDGPGEKMPEIVLSEVQGDSKEVEDELSSDSDNKLTICTNLPVKKRRFKRKRVPEDKPAVQDKVQEDLEAESSRNLGPNEIRKILKTVVSNDHVLAMVRLKEEELAEAEVEEEVEVETESADLMPKLTRLKAKELNKQLPAIVPLTLKAPEEESETAVLMTKELNEDTDDEEYKPSEEDFHSDDDTNTSISDMDSQPATPGGDSMPLPDGDDSIKYTKDGLFKIPQVCATPSPNKKSQEPFRPPALGTRSKVSLAKTTIEDIEETFVPPDITTDMYEFDCDMDNVWQEFLNEFRRPLTTTETHEEDDEADPEYVAADQIPLDKEELREVKVSRKELSDLMAELFDGIDDDGNPEILCPAVGGDEEEAGGARTKPTPTKYQKNRVELSPEPTMPFNMIAQSTPIVYHQNYQDLSKGDDVLEMSTVLENSLDMEEEEQQPENLQDTHSDSSTEVMSFSALDSPKQIYRKVIELKYRQMAKVQPVEIFEPGQIGFTDFQRQILAQQLRMHVQLNTQHFVQTYSHPHLWKSAEKPRKMLAELWDIAKSNRNSTFNAINLQGAVELCESWKREMDVINEENTEYVRELEDQLEIEEINRNNKNWKTKTFNTRIMDLMINSTVFLYPKLLPSIPFRVMPFHYTFHRHEGMAMAHFYDTIYRDLREQALKQTKYIEPSRRRVCDKINLFMCPWKTPRQIYKFLEREKNSPIMNPVKYYFENNRLLPVSHVIESINPNQVLANLPLSSLPKNWETFFQTEKKRKVKAQKERELLAKKRKRARLIQKFQAQKRNRANLNNLSAESLSEGDTGVTLTVSPEKQITIFSSNSLIVSINERTLLNSCTPESVRKPIEQTRLQETKENGESVLKRKLERILREYSQDLEEKLQIFKAHTILSKIYTFIREFDIFVRILGEKMQADKRIRESGEIQEDPKKLKLIDEKPMPEQKRHKHRLHDSNRLLLLPERNDDQMQRDSVYSWNFFERVECTFKSAKQFDKFERFLTILNTFKPGKDEVADLYYKLEDLFLPEYPELAELFLTFLLPGHAAQVGKFFEHFILTNMQTLLTKINIYFAKQPNQLKKIYASLSELTREEGLTMDKIKAKFLPLLKGNQLLTDWFLQLFPNERPPASDNDEFEVISLRKHATDEEMAQINLSEDIQAERFKDPFENSPCSIKYMQGRIYYGNRVLLPAELSFLASQEIDHRQDRESRERSPSACVHEIKHAWDAKIQEGLRLQQSDHADPGPSDASATDGAKESSSKSPGDSPAKLCDYATLKMHAYRLNPHAITSEMVLACQESAEEGSSGKQSPKKATGGKKNPTSPKRATTKGAAKPPETNSAIEMARRLKVFLTAEEKPPKPRRVRQKKPPEEEEEEKEEIVPEKVEKVEEDVTWTRDQDKMILEVINGELDSEEEVIERLVELMADRTREQITTRFHFLLNVLRKFQTDD